MNKPYKDFQFKQFCIQHNNAAMKIGTDGILLGAWADVSQSKNILDIGAGTGIIAIMQAQKNNQLNIEAIEIEKAACIDAQHNFNNCPWTKRLKLHHLSLSAFQPKKAYDTIISNPPFFENSLASKSVERNHARHNSSLHFNTIISFAVKNLSKNGSLSLILPVDQGLLCTINAEKSGLFIIRKCNVFPNSIKKQHRLLLEFSKTKKPLIESNLIIETNNRHEYTEDYKSLTRDFYIIFD
jgi:tRNA1Val (adenine37-N6)-methyltransferase